jgi:hypothetical protein
VAHAVATLLKRRGWLRYPWLSTMSGNGPGTDGRTNSVVTVRSGSSGAADVAAVLGDTEGAEGDHVDRRVGDGKAVAGSGVAVAVDGVTDEQTTLECGVGDTEHRADVVDDRVVGEVVEATFEQMGHV